VLRRFVAMAIKIEDVIAGKGEQESVSVDGLSVPVAALRNLSQEGYVNLRVYKDNTTFSLWGKNCSVCFTLEQLQEKVKSR
jgi:hypothetical protein